MSCIAIDTEITESCKDKPAPDNHLVLTTTVEYINLYRLRQGNEQDRIRFQLFSRLLLQFCQNVTHSHLDIMRKRYPQVYPNNYTWLYAFNLDVETIESQNWMKSNFDTYKKNFYRHNTPKIITTKWVVTNMLRHCIKWLNEFYNFPNPLVYQNVEMTWTRTNGESKVTNMNFICF